MKRLVLILFALLLASLNAIVCLDADGNSLDFQDRQYHLYHHHSTVDYYFYGSNEWAVRFDFRKAYPYGDGYISSINFQVQGARVWLPFTGGEATFGLYSDVNGQIGMELESITLPISNSLMDISFSQPYSASAFWLEVSYITNSFNRWVAASHGDGTNSYYLRRINQGNQDVWISNSFASQGFSAELLFGLLGDFEYNTPDLRLTSFDLKGPLLPRSTANPVFGVYNHGSTSVHSAHLRLEISQPDSTQNSTYSIPIPVSIPPYSYMEFGAEDSWLPQVALPVNSSQMRLQAILSSEYTENDTLLINNRISKSYNVFSEEMPVVLIENFLRHHESGILSTLQEPHLSPRHHPLYYYPIMVDSLANLPSERRFNWYQLNSLPYTLGMGNLRIPGIREDYSPLFEALSVEAAQRRTFISEATCQINPSSDSESILLDIQLTNSRSQLYTGSGQSITNNSRFFVALAQKQLIEGSEHYVLKRFIAFADTISTPLNAGQSVLKRYNFELSGISPQDLEENYRLYYWLQGNSERRIHYANYSEFSADSFTANSELVQSPAPQIFVYPNPLRQGENLSISAKNSANSHLKIYNLKGQLIYSEAEFKGSLSLDRHLLPASGVYFISLQAPDGRRYHKRITIIK